MIDALMYGMMPSAKIVTRDRLPPENMSYRPNMVPAAWRRGSSSAARVTPGTVITWTMRYTPSRPSVNSTRFRRSETVKMFFRLSIRSHDGFGVAACGENLFRRLPAELVRADGQRLRDVAAREHLDRPVGAVDEPALAQKLRRHDRARFEFRAERVEVDHGVLDAERIVE